MTAAWFAIAIGLALIGAALAPRHAVLAAALALTACVPRAETVAADRIARVANATTASLAETYTLQGEALIDQAGSREEALALLEAHRERWAPVWRQLDALAAAHSAWATSIETGRTSPETLTEMSAAWCELIAAVGEVGAELPAIARELPTMCEVAP